jgi:hypothetical protein
MVIDKKIRFLIRELIGKHVEEERIPNTEADEYVNKKENFIGSHTYGENIGDLDKMYVAYSYGEQHPLFVWIDKKEFSEIRPNETNGLVGDKSEIKKYKHLYDNKINHEKINDEEDMYDLSYKKGPWFYNEKPYYVKDKKGKLKPNKWTYKHLNDLKPNDKLQARETLYLQRLITDFKNKYNIGNNNHSNLEPGEK